jgi:ABC-2 type transport system ATP-binding protein
MKKQGRTIIYTTHYMEEAERICDRVAILDYGKILDMDTVHNLIAKHGGLSHIEAELEQSPPDPEKIKQLINHKDVQLKGTKIKFETDKPMESLAMLNRSSVSFKSLKVEMANLEDVFLNLTGRRLRD